MSSCRCGCSGFWRRDPCAPSSRAWRLTRISATIRPSATRASAPQAIVLTGANGGGKTNLLEAISLLAPGRGLRGAAFEDVVRAGSRATCRVAADLSGPPGEVALAASFSGAPADEEEEENGPRQGSERRRDRPALCRGARPAHAGRVADTGDGPAVFRPGFGAAPVPRPAGCGHRSRTWQPDAGVRETHAPTQPAGDRARGDRIWLSGVEQQMAEAAVALAAGRLAALEELKGAAGDSGASSFFPWVNLAVAGEIEAMLAAAPAIQVEDRYRKMLHDSRVARPRRRAHPSWTPSQRLPGHPWAQVGGGGFLLNGRAKGVADRDRACPCPGLAGHACGGSSGLAFRRRRSTSRSAGGGWACSRPCRGWAPSAGLPVPTGRCSPGSMAETQYYEVDDGVLTPTG